MVVLTVFGVVFCFSDVVNAGPTFQCLKSLMYQWAMTFHCCSMYSDRCYCVTVPCIHRMTVTSSTNKFLLASCLINAQPLPAHWPAADDHSFIGCTRPRPDRWLVTAQCPFRWQLMPTPVLVWVRSFIEPDVLKTVNHLTRIYLINLLWKLGLGFGLDSELHYFSIYQGE